MTDPAHAAPSQPEPVLQAARWASIIVTAVAAVGAGFGSYAAVTHATWALGLAAALATVTMSLAAVIPSMTAQGARAQVTPLQSPRTVDGQPAELVATPAVSPLMGPDTP